MLTLRKVSIGSTVNLWQLYYTPQTDAWIAWGVSFAALFATIGIGVYGWKESRKEKRGKQFIR